MFVSHITKLGIALTATALLMVVGIINFNERLAQPQIPDDGVLWVNSPRGVQAESVRPESAASRAGILKGDYLRAVNIDSLTYDAIRTAAEAEYYLQRAGVGGNIICTIERLNSQGVSTGLWDAEVGNIEAQPTHLARGLYLAFIGLLYLGIGLYVLLKQSRVPFTWHFYALCLAAFVVHFFSSTGKFDRFDEIIYILDDCTLFLFAPLLVHFCALFPLRSGALQRNRLAKILLYLPASLFITTEIAFAIWPGLISAGFPNLRRYLDDLLVAQFALALVVSAVFLIRTYVKAVLLHEPELRRQMKVVVWGVGVGAFPFAIASLIGWFGGEELPPTVEALTIGPLILVPLALGYAVRRYRLMDVDVMVRRSMVYASATLAVAAMFMLVVVTVGELVRNLAPGLSVLVQVGVMTMIAMLFTPLKNWIEIRLDRLFYGERYDLRSRLSDFGQMISTTTALEPLLDALSSRLSEMLSVSSMAIFIEDGDHPSGFSVARQQNLSGQITLPGDIRNLLRVEDAHRGYVVTDELPQIFDSKPATYRLHYFVPCVVRDRMIAILGFGRTMDGDLLSTEDLQMLRSLSGYVAAAIENSLLYRTEKERVAELANLKEFNENIIESIGVGIMTTTESGMITNWNERLEELLRIPRSETIGKEITQVFDPDLLQTIRSVVGEEGWQLREPRNIYKFRMATGDGRELVLNFSLRPLYSKTGETVGAIITVEDVTDRVRLEEQLQQNEKLSSIGLLAAGVAHEVNTPLTGISSYTQMLISQLPKADPKRTLLEEIHLQTARASGIVNNLLNFSRTGNTQFSEFDVHRVLDDTLQLVEPQLRNTGTAIEKRFHPNLPNGWGNPAKLQQVFMNLILNARDAMPSGGTLTVATGLNDTQLIIDFEDTGVGIAPEHIPRIYDPFFTTKGVGQGTGLGLAVSYGIVQEHGGRIFVSSTAGEGTRFRLKLPSSLGRMQAAGD